MKAAGHTGSERTAPAERAGESRGGCARVVQLCLAWVVAPVVLLVLVEAGLRVAGYGRSTRLFRDKQIHGQPYCQWNEDFYHQFFSGPEGYRIEPREVLIPAVKPANTYRVFILGGSAANGWVIADYSFWRILEVMLRTRFPNTNIEVYNLAYHGMNSHIIRHVANACAALHPDLFVVYMGNNEVVGPFGFQQEQGLARFLPQDVKRVCVPEGVMLLLNLRITQVLRGRVLDLSGGRAFFAGLRGPDDHRLESVYQRFRRNIEDICDAGNSVGAAVALCTVGRNLRCWRPEFSVHRPGWGPANEGQWQADYEAGIERQNAGAYREAIEHYGRAAALDDTFADLQFRLGRCHWAAGDHARARECFIRAAERDASLTCANARVNDTIAAVATSRTEKGVYLVDAARSLAEQSPHQIPGDEFFYDSVHLTFEGNYVIARAVFERITEALPEWMRSRAEGGVAAPSLADCQQRMALTPADRLRMARLALSIEGLSDNQPTDGIEQRVAALEQQVVDRDPGLLLEAHRRAVELNGGDHVVRSQYVQSLLSFGHTEQALQEARGLVSDFPHRRIALRLLGIALAKEGRGDEAEAQFRQAVALNPDDFVTYCELGGLLREAGRLDEALDAYREALSINRYYAPAKYRQAGVWADTGDFQTALDSIREALALWPECAGEAAAVLGDSALKFQRKGAWDKAIEGHRAAVAIEPENAWWRVCLARDLEHKGDFYGAIEAFREAIAMDAAFAGGASESLTKVAAKYAATGDWDKALEAYRAVITLAPEAWPPYLSLDEAFRERNDTEGRMAEWRRAVQEYPEAVRPLFHLGAALRDAGRADEAVEAFGKALALDPSNDEVRGHLGCVLVWEGDFDAALRVCREPTLIEACFAVMVADALEDGANTLVAQNRAEQAANGYRAAIALAPASAAERCPLLIEALCEAGDYEAARKEVAACKERGVELPAEFLERLVDKSGTTK